MKAVTGADGIAKVKLTAPRRTWEPLVAFATTEAGGFGVASTSWQDGISPWDFGTQGASEPDPYIGYVYTDRPIYRPDQTVYWKAIFRRDNDAQFALPAPGQPVTVTIRDDQGNQLLEQKLTLNPVGAVDGKLELGPEAALGYYYISLQMDKERSYGVGFQVAEYRKPEYEISAATDKPEYVQGEQINVTVQANYFFGGPVQNGKVRWTLMSADAPFNYQGEGYWSFEDYDWYEPMQPGQFGGQISQGEGKTDAQGRFSFSVPADINKFQRSQRFTFDITVQDVNNQAVSTQTSAVVHKGEYYIGLSPRSYVVTQGEPAQVDVITVDAQSQPVPDTKVDLVVSQIEWMSVREKAADGNSYWVTPAQEDAGHHRDPHHRREGRGRAELDAQGPRRVQDRGDGPRQQGPRHPQRGVHLGQRAQLRAVAARRTTTASSWWPTSRSTRSATSPRSWSPSPYQGKVKALLTTERGQVLSSKVIELAGNSEVVKLPITAEDAPNIFVSLVLMKGMDKTTPLGSFKVGLTPLKVSVADKELQVILTPRRGEVASPTTAATTGGATTGGATPPLQVAPRDTVTWDVQTLDAAGKPVPGRRLAGAGGQGRADAGRRQRRQADGSLLLSARAGRADRRHGGAQRGSARRPVGRGRQGRRRWRRRPRAGQRPPRVPRHRLLAGERDDRRRREGAGPGDAARQPDHLDDGRPRGHRRHAGGAEQDRHHRHQGPAGAAGAAALLRRRRPGRDRRRGPQHDRLSAGGGDRCQGDRPRPARADRQHGHDPGGRHVQGGLARGGDVRRGRGQGADDRRTTVAATPPLEDAVEITLPVYRYTTPEVVGHQRPGGAGRAAPRTGAHPARAPTPRRASST